MTGTRTEPAIIRTEKQAMASDGKPPFRADHVGSLLRPPAR